MRATGIRNGNTIKPPAGSSQENRPSGAYRAATQPGGYLWPELRVGRSAPYEEFNEWDLFLNRVGKENARKGIPLVLGLVACHYVLDIEMRAMILKRYEQIGHDRKGARNVYREIAKSVNQFIAEAQRVQRKYVYGEDRGLLGQSVDKDTYQPHCKVPRPSCLWEYAEFELPDTDHASFNSYDGNKIGIDLSAHGALREERAEILQYLKQEERLDTRIVRRDWEPHATIFMVHPHLSAEAVSFHVPVERPRTLLLDRPQAA